VTQEIRTLLLDDLDGSDADETFTFEFDGRSYEIDLTTEHAEQLEEAFQLLDPFVDHLRRVVPGRTKRTTRPRKAGAKKATTRSAPSLDAKAIRVWAWENGIELSSRGRIPANIVDKWRAAVDGS
jgi:Lsr2